MTSLAQVTALVDAHVSRDHARFRAITLQIAAHVASRSERGADQLRKLVENQQAMSLVPLPSASCLLSSPSDLSTLDAMVLAPHVRDRLDRVVLEQARRTDLIACGLSPARKLLFTGAPGVGKTMAAGALARAIGMPMFRVELHGVISQFLGETSSKLAKVFEHVRSMPAVYLFDEFDALGSERSVQGGESAGAEMRRVVNSLLQFIEDDRSDSLIVAATNHDQMLDSAMFRRFDEVVVFGGPTRDEVAALVRHKLVTAVADANPFDQIDEFDVDQIDVATVYAAIPNPRLGHADVCAALDGVRKDHVLVGSAIDTQAIVAALVKRVRVSSSEVIS
jgi:SpoVK/Ycf46/Vps4 family AAA+-type ATPase